MNAVIVTRSPLVGAVALTLSLLVVLGAVLSAVAPGVAPTFGLLAFAFGWPFAVAATLGWLAYAWPARHAATVTVNDEGELAINGVVRYGAGALTRGEAAVLGKSVRVELGALRRAELRLEVGTKEEARALLAAVGLDRRLGTSQFKVRRLREHAGLVVIGALFAAPIVFVVCLVSPAAGIALVSAVWGWPIYDAVRSRLVLTIGADGFDIRSPVGAEFLGHADVKSIARSPHGFDLELRDGTARLVDTRTERMRSGELTVDAAYDAAARAWTAWRESVAGSASSAAALLARGSRTSQQWAAELRGLATSGGASGYRVQALDEETLFSTLADAAAPRELRAAAAVVLGANEEHAPRLRVVADDLADPVVRRIATSEGAEQLESDLDEAAAPSLRRATR